MQPTNTNVLQQNKFLLTFTRIPNVQYFCQVVALPGLTLGEALQNDEMNTYKDVTHTP